jgi:hypothetical protein
MDRIDPSRPSVPPASFAEPSLDELDRLIDGALRRLPTPHAPDSLLPRVLAAAEHLEHLERIAGRPWYGRAWVTWPLAWQGVSVAAMALLLATAATLLPALQQVLRYGATAIHLRIPGIVLAARDFADATAAGAPIIWRVLGAPVLGYAAYLAAFLLVMGAACVVFWTTLNRVALGGAVES